MTKDEGQATVNERRSAGAELSSSVVRHSSPDNTPPSAAADRQAFFILKNLGAAVREFDMIRDGDRIAVAVSGGKDSLGLLRLLQAYRRSAGVRFELAVIHVLGDATGVIALHPPLGEWLAGQDVPCRVVLPDLAADDAPPLTCQRCTWLRRKALFQAAAALGCNVVAFAHHADDAAQTTLLNLLYGGDVRTLAPCADYFDGRFRLIRPLIYVPESDLKRFAHASGFPPPPLACPRSDNSRRRRVAEMLKLLGRDYLTQARPNLIRAGLRRGRTVDEGRMTKDEGW
jgi:tRNA 2-thiocytidine biosynthesis protein TtcA